MTPFLVIPLVFAGAGGVFATLGVAGLRRQIAFRRRAVRCAGVVVDVRARWSSGVGDGPGQTLHYPVLAFRTADGREVTTESRVGTSWSRLRPGQEVAVLYDPRDPAHAQTGSGRTALLVWSVFTVLGSVFTAIGLVGLAVVAALG